MKSNIPLLLEQLDQVLTTLTRFRDEATKKEDKAKWSARLDSCLDERFRIQSLNTQHNDTDKK